MSALFQPLTIREVTLKNRIAMSPMCMYSSEDGFVNDWHFVHYGSRAVGGAGLILVEATAVAPEGRITPDDLGIWKDEHIEGLRKISGFMKQHGAVPGIQLAHAGRKASHQSPWKGGAAIPVAEQNGWETVAPSAIPFSEQEPAPHALTVTEIQQVITSFKAAASRALEAGFQVLEIHGAHGYLLHEFLSPLSNTRTDDYGGSFENRIRLITEVTLAIRCVWPEEFPLFVRLSATDWTEGGWTAEDSVRLAKVLQENGVDLIDCSTGGNVPAAKIPVEPGYQVPFAERIKKEAGVRTGAVGLITDAKQAERIIADGKADLVLLAREFLRDPYFPLHAAHELQASPQWPLQYERAKPR
ncbi:NADPH dehydrogenase NamA [Pontibacter qinzhouensis]|uniref:NADPH dehydrogenase NamA n=1 Tax=Pontibacter qinzhouensis TaxID=2603253 RepID=A0A5C8KDZ3_9BACT|nr:NADPH dehydrogenase NamA [Pontibacter qinzhouensis]TXK52158.1 NADPH dehydrogenase NamA [Pontibacter qinzhouensis]